MFSRSRFDNENAEFTKVKAKQKPLKYGSNQKTYRGATEPVQEY